MTSMVFDMAVPPTQPLSNFELRLGWVAQLSLNNAWVNTTFLPLAFATVSLQPSNIDLYRVSNYKMQLVVPLRVTQNWDGVSNLLIHLAVSGNIGDRTLVYLIMLIHMHAFVGTSIDGS